MKNLLTLLILFVCSVFVNAQDNKAKLFGNIFSFEHEVNNNMLQLCLIQTEIDFCKKYPLENGSIENTRKLFDAIDDFIILNHEIIDLEIKDFLAKETNNSTNTLTLDKTWGEWSETLSETIDLPNDLQQIKEYANNTSSSSKIIFKKLVHAYLKNKMREKGVDFLKSIIQEQETFHFLMNQKLVTKHASPTLQHSSNPEEFALSVLVEKDVFHLQLESNKDIRQIPFEREIYKERFLKRFYEQFDTISETNTNTSRLIDLYIRIQEEIAVKTKTEFKAEVQQLGISIFDSIKNEKKTFSGQLILKEKFEVDILSDLKTKSFRHDKVIRKDSFHVKKGTIRFFNNRIDNFSVYGSLKSSPDEMIVLYNEGYSVPLRSLNRKVYVKEKIHWKKKYLKDRVGKNFKFPKTKKFIIYSVADAIDYLPIDRFNYSVKNQELELKIKDTVKVEERSVSDYFTGVFFSDLLGINSANSNNLIIAEGKLRFPIHLRNWQTFTLVDHFSGSVAISLFNGFNSESKTLELNPIETSQSELSNSSVLNHHLMKAENQPSSFDLLVNNNIDASLELSLISQDWKQARTFIHLGFGFRFLRTAVSFDQFETSTDTTTQTSFVSNNDFQVFSVGKQINLTFEVRPQANIGADLVLGINWLSPAGTSLNGVDFITEDNKSENIKLMLELFALTDSQKKSGIYFRIGGHYDRESSRVFPQLMAGFATNLSTFVNKLKTDK